MPAYKIYTGTNCHADVVVEGSEYHPEYVSTAKAEFIGQGFEVSSEAILGNFCVWGAAHHESKLAKLTVSELAKLESLGEVIGSLVTVDSFRFSV